MISKEKVSTMEKRNYVLSDHDRDWHVISAVIGTPEEAKAYRFECGDEMGFNHIIDGPHSVESPDELPIDGTEFLCPNCEGSF